MLKPAARLTVKPNTFVFIGHSDSPRGAVVLSVTTDKVTFRTYPYAEGMEHTERRDIFEALAYAGMTTRMMHEATATIDIRGRIVYHGQAGKTTKMCI